MSHTCTDIRTSLNAYLDSELEEADLREFESHLNDCHSCQEMFTNAEQAHRALRSHLQATPPASEFLTKKIMSALDQEDAQQRSTERLRWLSLPSAAMVLAAAALALFIWNEGLSNSSTDAVAKSSQVTRDAARQHFRETPLFVSNDRGSVGRGAADFLNTPVHAPRFYSSNIKLIGWTPTQIGGRQSATFVYEFVNQTGRHRVHVQTVDVAYVNLNSQRQQTIDGTKLWVDSAYGFNAVTYASADRLAYIFSSDISVDALIELVSSTDTVNTVLP